jgi:hypothetical protein
MAQIFHYHDETKEFLMSSEARPDPIDGNDMLPRNAVFTTPPPVAANAVATWDGTGWNIEADYRGSEYWMADGTRHVIAAIGEVIPQDGMNAPPPPTVEEVTAAYVEAVRREIQRRIFAEVSQNTQINMGGESAAGLFDAAQQAAFVSGLHWIKAMRATALALAQAGDQTFADDVHWPAVPADAKTLADSF